MRQHDREIEMSSTLRIAAVCLLMGGLIPPAMARRARPGVPQPQSDAVTDPIKILVNRLDLEKYKATIKGLTQFGDRRQGTDRNRQAIDWIEAQLKSYGCTNTERIRYVYQPPARGGRNGAGAPGGGRGGDANTAGGGRGGRGVPGGAVLRGERGPVGVNNDPDLQTDTRLRE